jgi:hypothetical protein
MARLIKPRINKGPEKSVLSMICTSANKANITNALIRKALYMLKFFIVYQVIFEEIHRV